MNMKCLDCKFYITAEEWERLHRSKRRWCLFREFIPKYDFCDKFEEKEKGGDERGRRERV